MIDRTTTELASESDYLLLFINLVENNAFNIDKSADIRVTPSSYIFATRMAAGALSPMRIVVGDYTMRLHL